MTPTTVYILQYYSSYIGFVRGTLPCIGSFRSFPINQQLLPESTFSSSVSSPAHPDSSDVHLMLFSEFESECSWDDLGSATASCVSFDRPPDDEASSVSCVSAERPLDGESSSASCVSFDRPPDDEASSVSCVSAERPLEDEASSVSCVSAERPLDGESSSASCVSFDRPPDDEASADASSIEGFELLAVSLFPFFPWIDCTRIKMQRHATNVFSGFFPMVATRLVASSTCGHRTRRLSALFPQRVFTVQLRSVYTYFDAVRLKPSKSYDWLIK